MIVSSARAGTCRYNDIAKKTVAVQSAQKQLRQQGDAAGGGSQQQAQGRQHGQWQQQPQGQQWQAAQNPSMSMSLGQELYRIALCTVFLLQAAAAGFVPFVGDEYAFSCLQT